MIFEERKALEDDGEEEISEDEDHISFDSECDETDHQPHLPKKPLSSQPHGPVWTSCMLLQCHCTVMFIWLSVFNF